jgi:nicotinamidase-related amidase
VPGAAVRTTILRSALKDRYTVYFVSDCSSGVTQEAHEDAKLANMPVPAGSA